jgi:diguanylate cyclase (GGDEF)-like protein
MFFAVPPCVGIAIQVLLYGTSLIISGVAVSLLIVFLNVQNKSIHTDYLTGVSNRKRLESFLDERIATSTADRTFSAILIDLDNFKAINDTFGHDMGDKALQISAELLKSCVRSDDLIARFGGDEFCVVLRAGDRSALDAIVQRINNCVAKYNEFQRSGHKCL